VEHDGSRGHRSFGCGFYYSVMVVRQLRAFINIHESNRRWKRANSLTGNSFCQCDPGGLRLQLPNRSVYNVVDNINIMHPDLVLDVILYVKATGHAY